MLTCIREELVLHLSPRQAYKMMRTSKAWLRLIRNHRNYWERVAFFLLKRGYSDPMRFVPYRRAMDLFRLKHVGEDIRAIVTENLEDLDLGYHQVMLPTIDDPWLVAKLMVQNPVETRCELVGMYRIAIALGKPTTFLSWNPFEIGETEEPPAEALLLSVLQEALAHPQTAFLTLVYICYSQSAALPKIDYEAARYLRD